MSQGGIALEEGKAYTLTVVAFASQNKTINAALGKASAPWNSYISEPLNLTTTPQTFVIQGVMSSSDPDARVVLNLGGDAGDVMLQEISVVEDVVSSNEYFEENGLVAVYPNPFRDKFVVSSSEKWSKLSIYNVLGGLVYEDKNYEVNKSFDLPLQTGIYYVKLKINKLDKIVKVIKK